MKYFSLLLHMVRYKSALVLVLFMVLSNIIHNSSGASLLSLQAGGMAAALVLVYVCATCVNDIVDWKIDEVNLKGHNDRPLVTGEGSRKDLFVIAIGAGLAAIVIGLFINEMALAAIFIGLISNTAYSIKPIQISHRAVLTPFYLAFCYVFVAYLAGYAVSLSAGNYSFNGHYLIIFYLLFLARISLKDFRDRKGDALAGKPTLLLKYGKRTVCLLSTLSVLVGGGYLLLEARNLLSLQIVLAVFLASLLVVEYKLYAAKKEIFELLCVGYGARMGNGLLFILLGTLLLRAQEASMGDLWLFYSGMIFLYGWLFWRYVTSPELFYFGKRKVA